jgi:phi13 family phage major tail protein|nr:MAG TPA: tail tube protein [Caudoviricetes sp.]
MPKKYLKGFSKFSIFPILENTETSYKVGTRVPVISAQKLSKEEQSTEDEILADDEIWDIDSDVTGETVTITLAELSNELRAKLKGGTYNSETKTYSFKKGDVAPELACSYRGLLADGTYRMWKQYRFKVSKIKMDLETKGNGNKGGVEITGNFLNRSCDGLFYDIQDTEEGNKGLSWLDTIAEVKPAQETQSRE